VTIGNKQLGRRKNN